jgi:polysaccharide biosynthesis transport protein
MQPENAGSGIASVSSDGGETIDLRAYWRTIVRRRWLAIPFFLATVLVAAVTTLRQTKMYDATCTIIIDLAAPRVLDDQQMQDVVQSGTGGYWYSREYYETQYKVIASRAVAQRVVDSLGLGTNDAFLGTARIADPDRRKAARAGVDAVGKVASRLKIEPVKDSRVVRLRVEDSNPEMAAMIANAVADAYIAQNLAVRNATTQSASIWLEDQLQDLEAKLGASGKSLFEFKRTHDIVATSWEDRQSMVSQRLTAINDALTKARVKRAELQARVDALRPTANGGTPAIEYLDVGADNTVIPQLKMKLQETRLECADLEAKYLEGHPRVVACSERLRLAQGALDSEVSSAIGAARKAYEEVVATEKNLSALLNEAKTDAFGLNQYEQQYLELKRTNDNNQRLYELILKRLKDTGVTGMLQASNVRVLEPARPRNSPIRPNLSHNVFLAIVLGLLGGIGLAFAAELLDNSIISQEQIENRLGLTFLGIIPQIARSKDGRAQDLIVHTQPKSAVAECLRAVRTNLLFMSPERPLRTILVTSSGPQDGKTTTVATLAGTMAESGNRVLVLDADMRRPRVHRVYEVDNSRGLSSLILGEGSIEEVVHATSFPNVFVLPCGPVPPNPAELLHTGAFNRILADLAGRYDRVIIDSPPVGIVADAAVIATQVDGTVLVLKANQTSRDLARQAVRALNDVKARIFGAVLNDLDLENQRYGQYYYYRYGYYYGNKRDDKAA